MTIFIFKTAKPGARLWAGHSCISLCCVVAAMILGRAVPAWTQDYIYATGSPNFGVNFPVPDGYINVTNGNLHLDIPLGSYNQMGNLPTVKISLEYDSRIWKIVDAGGHSWQPTNVPDPSNTSNDGNSMAGWRVVTGMDTGQFTYASEIATDTVTGSCGSGGESVPTYVYFSGFTWTDSNGTKHTFSENTDLPVSINISCSGPGANPGYPYGDNVALASSAGYAIDGSGYYLVDSYMSGQSYDGQSSQCLTSPSSSCITATVYDSSGNQVYPTLDLHIENTAVHPSATAWTPILHTCRHSCYN